MPLNLPPEALKAEERYRAARTPEEKVDTLKEFLSLIPKHKGTDHLRADLRRRLSKLQEAATKSKGPSRHESAFRIPREGAGQVAVVGPPNVGKSALVDALTNATPEVAPSPFTTWEPMPGMMEALGVQIQLIDTPPLNPDYVEPALMDLIRHAELVLLVVDLQTSPVDQLESSVALLREHRIHPRLHADDVPDDPRHTVLPFVVVANKADDDEGEEIYELFMAFLEEDWDVVSVSATTGRNLDALRRVAFDRLELARIFSKPPGKPADMDAPFAVRRGTTVEEFAGKVHKEILERLTGARVWGSAQHDGQMVSRDHILEDGDVVELRT